MDADRIARLDYSDLPDLLKNLLDSIDHRIYFKAFKDILKDVSFFLDEPDFRLKLMSAIGWSNTLITIDLRSVGMSAQDAQELRLGLRNSGLIHTIRAGCQRSLGDAGAVQFAKLLEVSSSLAELELPSTNIGTEGAAALGEALKLNRSLVRLDLSSNLLQLDGIEALLEPLTAAPDRRLPVNTILQTLLIHGASNKLCKKGAKAVNLMLRTNAALTELSVNLDPLSDSGVDILTYPLTTARVNDNVQHQANKALTRLTIGFARKAKGSGGNGAHGIIKMVENNYVLKVLSLINFEQSWETDDIRELFLALKKNSHLQELKLGGCMGPAAIFASMQEKSGWGIQSSAPFIIEKPHPPPLQYVSSSSSDTQFFKPKIARILLCGHPDAGISSTAKDSFMKLLKNNRFSPMASSIHVEEIDDFKLSIWNFRDPEVYNCFQNELLLPNLTASEAGATSFIVVCNSLQTHGIPGAQDLPKSDVELKEEISYWLQFIASSIPTPMRLAPLIWIAISPPLRDQHERLVKDSINMLASKYEEVLTVDRKPFYFDDTKRSVVEIKEKLVVKLIERYQLELPNVSNESLNAGKFLRKLKDEQWLRPESHVFNIWQQSVSHPIGDNGQFYQQGARALHDAGEIILWKDFEKKEVIVKPDKFISDIIPRLLDICSKELARDLRISEGWVPELSLETYLTTKQRLDGPLIALLMRWLKLCYKSMRADDSYGDLFIPRALTGMSDDGDTRGTQQLEWLMNRTGDYVGRRYLSRDKVHTFMTQSLFHQLQLEISRDGELMTDGHHPECKVTLQRNIIRIVTDSMEILVQFGAFVGYFIDVMVRSKVPYTQTVAFIHKYVRNPITRLSKSTKGLEECLIRPLCVSKLIPCKYRQSQVVTMKHLKAQFRDASCPLNYQHDWDEVEDVNRTSILEAGSDLVIKYLDKKDCLDILKRKNISAVPSENLNLSDLLTPAPCRFCAAGSFIGPSESSLHKLFVRDMIQRNTEVQKMLFSGAMPTLAAQRSSLSPQLAEIEVTEPRLLLHHSDSP